MRTHHHVTHIHNNDNTDPDNSRTPLTPFSALPRLIQRTDGICDLVRVPGKHALAKLVPGPMTALRRMPLGRLQERLRFLNFACAAQQLQELV